MRKNTQSRQSITVRRLPGIALAAAVAGGCEGVQSALDPAGTRAETIADVWWVMFWGGAAILLLVMTLALYTLRRRRPNPRFNGNAMIIGGGILLPVAALTALLLVGYRVGALHEAPVATRLSVEVTGQRFWWRIRYPGAAEVESASELRIPAGEPVEIRLRSRDVIHSFWVPRLAGKLDLIPGRENRLWLQADRPGVFRGQCAEFCGAEHARMILVVVAQPREEFEAWLAAQQRPAAAEAPGLQTFLDNDCQACHRIRGTAADGRAGPDLTHIASRWQRVAAAAPAPAESLAEWIRVSHWSVGPELDPSPLNLDAAALAALAEYLESLE
jgi:cytochrome c oxidase subunit 2